MWCVIIPTYNNATTIRQVISDVSEYTGNIIVVNDGCTDNTVQILSETGVTVVNHERNKGKGCALKSGFSKAREMGFDHAITFDADGQHFASDIPKFTEILDTDKESLVIGSRNLQEKGMPAQNTFANKFSNFWFRIQTGIKLPDTQTGFRLYPLQRMGTLRWITSRYEAELEMLVFAAWHGINIISTDINVYYPKADMRVSHFRPVYDFTRISILNTLLCILALLYYWPAKIIRNIR